MAGRYLDFSPGFKLLLLFLIMLAGVVVVSLITGLLGWYFFGNLQFDLSLLLEHTKLLKLIQSVQTVVIFIIPSIIAARLFWPESFYGLVSGNGVSLKLLLAAVVTMALSQYFIGWTGAVNSQLVLPDGWVAVSEWIEKTEQEALNITNALTGYNSLTGFYINVILIALLPAIGEEWLFRGHVQRYFSDWFRNPHVAIFVTAIIFSAMHLQFMTFLPRFFLGMILGYLFYIGGNLWYSVAGHFTNNFFALWAMKGRDISSLDNSIPDIHFSAGVVVSALSVVAMLFIISRVKHAETLSR